MKTLAVVQGPTQALAAIAVIRDSLETIRQAKHKSDKGPEVHFAVGDLCAGNSTARLLHTTKQLINANDYYFIHDLTSLDAKFYAGCLTFDTFCAELRKAFGSLPYDTVYVCRRMALLNEAVLSLYPNARKICYGDGFGALDNGRQTWCNPRSPIGFQMIDACAGVAPYEENCRGALGKSVTVTGPASLKRVIAKSINTVLPELDGVRREISAYESIAIITTSNLVESGSAKCIRDEIDFYVDNISGLLGTKKTMCYIVKGHPRETKNQSESLTKEIQSAGINCLSLRNQTSIPTELILGSLTPSLVVPLLSSSGFVTRLLNKHINIHYSEHSQASARKRLINTVFDWPSAIQKLQALTLLASYPWERCVSYGRLWLNAAAFRNLGISFPALSPDTLATQSLRFARYQASVTALALVAACGNRSRAKFLRSFIQ
jgi:hypothetical protein